MKKKLGFILIALLLLFVKCNCVNAYEFIGPGDIYIDAEIAKSIENINIKEENVNALKQAGVDESNYDYRVFVCDGFYQVCINMSGL